MLHPLARLHDLIASACPIDGVAVGRWDDRNTWRIDYAPDATSEQRAVAAQMLAALDVDEFLNPPPAAPMAISPRQARLALLSLGLLDQVNKAIAGGPVEMQIAWEFSTEVRRDDPGLIALAKQLGIADRLPELFTMAVAL
jgi:hypothetical protein